MQICIDARSPYAFERIYSIALIERILRQLFELGIRKHVTVILKPDMQLERFIRGDFWPRYHIEFDKVFSEAPLLRLVDSEKDTDQSLMLLEGDGIYDERVLKRLLMSTNSLCINAGNDEAAPIAFFVQSGDRQYLRTDMPHIREFLQQEVQKGWLKALSIYDMDRYIPELRQTATPYLIKLQHKASIRAIENEMYEKTFKGVIDFIATYGYRIPVRGLVRLLAPTRITPNHITAISVICSFAPIPLFAMGWLGTGLAVAFIFVIADSLDGKLARLTIRTSKVADKVDHFTSPLFEVCYFLAWGWYFSGGDFSTLPGKAAFLLSCFFGLDRIVTSVFGFKFGRSLLDYKGWDARFHLIAARRNINLFIMTIGFVFQKPIIALYVITIWMFITMLWHIYRFALHAYQRGISLRLQNT
jgi:phosphatidylglycerophosphate synthase